LYRPQRTYKIPKVIHQTYSKYDNIPDNIKKIMEKTRRMNSDWEYKFYDDKDVINYIKKYYGKRELNAYNRLNPKYGPARADFFRYLLLYREGGVYLDCKSTTRIPLNDIIKDDDELLLAHWKSRQWDKYVKLKKGEFQNWHIMIRPKHPLLLNVINIVIDTINANIGSDASGKVNVLFLTGPIPYTLGLKHKLKNYHHRIYDSHREMGLIYSYKINNKSHEQDTKNHYTTLKEPIILDY